MYGSSLQVYTWVWILADWLFGPHSFCSSANLLCSFSVSAILLIFLLILISHFFWLPSKGSTSPLFSLSWTHRHWLLSFQSGAFFKLKTCPKKHDNNISVCDIIVDTISLLLVLCASWNWWSLLDFWFKLTVINSSFVLLAGTIYTLSLYLFGTGVSVLRLGLVSVSSIIISFLCLLVINPRSISSLSRNYKIRVCGKEDETVKTNHHFNVNTAMLILSRFIIIYSTHHPPIQIILTWFLCSLMV